MDQKINEIEWCLEQDPVDLWRLRELALTHGGLVTAELRQRAWPILLGFSGEEREDSLQQAVDHCDGEIRRFESSLKAAPTTPERKKNRQDFEEKDLIQRDVGRSVLFRFREANDAESDNSSESNDGSEATPGGQSSRGDTRSIAPMNASDMLAKVLEITVSTPLNSWSNAKIHYYQGLHDIGGVMLHNFDYNIPQTAKILRRVCHSHLRDALRENFGNVTWILSSLLLPLVEKVDRLVHYALLVSGVDLSNTCLPWIITWYGHDIHNHKLSGILMDAFIVSHPLLPFYVAVALLTHPLLKKKIIDAGELSDPASMFVIVKGLTKHIVADVSLDSESVIPVQELLEDAIAIMNMYPPRALLDLINPSEVPREDVLKRASSVAMFRSPPSWAVSGGLHYKPNSLSRFDHDVSEEYIHSKLASGVPSIMKTVHGADVICKDPTWGSRHRLKPRKKSKWDSYVDSIYRHLSEGSMTISVTS